MLQRIPGTIAPKRSGESESNAEEYCTGQSSPKRSKQNERERDPSFAEISFNIDIIYKEKNKETLQKLIKHIVALLNSAGGVIRINESGNDEKTIIKQRDIWKQRLEQTLVDILTQDEYKQCIHFNSASKFPHCYLFVRKSKRVCTQSSGLKIPLECSIKDATYNGILNILNRKSVSVSQRESSSLEMSDEDMEPDSGCTPDEEHAEFHYEKNVSFNESDTVQFKLIKEGSGTMKDLLKGIDSHLPNYVSAFANYRGGKVYFGIHDDGTVKGQLVEGEDEKREVQETVEKVMKRNNENQEMLRIWGKPDFIPQYGAQWTVDFVEVIGKPKGQSGCVVVVTIFHFHGGMFLEHPLAWKVDETSETIDNMGFDEWRSRHTSDSEDYQEMLKRFERLELDGNSKKVFQLKDMAKNFAKTVFPAKKGLTFVPENFAERFKVEQENAGIQLLQLKLQQSYSDEKGFVMIDKLWSGNIGFEPAPEEVVCDIFVVSHNFMPRMITVARKYSEKVKKYNVRLATKLKLALVNEGGCLQCFGIYAEVIVLNNLNQIVHLPLPISHYPSEYKMTKAIFSKIQEALVIVLAGFESSIFNPTVGVNFLYVLTPEQHKIIIKDDPHVIVSAPPGTGKTVVAIERINRLRKRKVSKDEILYICENLPLAFYVRSLQICRSLTRSEFMSCFRSEEFDRIRHVVVDEAQNFQNEKGEDWFKNIVEILSWPSNSQQHYKNTSLYIFCDNLQKMKRAECGLGILDSNDMPHVLLDPFPTTCKLTSVIRNSNQIYRNWENVASRQSDFESDSLKIAHDYEGQAVNVVKLPPYADNECIFNVVNELINEILHEKSYKASDIAVLFTKRDIAKCFEKFLRNHLAMSDICVTNAEVFPREGLVVDSFRRFSGLEAPVVIAVTPKANMFEHEEKVYIMLYSRAMVEFHCLEYDFLRPYFDDDTIGTYISAIPVSFHHMINGNGDLVNS